MRMVRTARLLSMEPRLKYGQLAPEGLAKMTALEHYLNTGSELEASLRELVRLRASLMNGCEYCVRLHTSELQKVNETMERIAGVADWRSLEIYTKRERAALAWAEAVTNIQDGHAPDVVYDEVRAHFSDVETVNLTLVISTINAWNRISISLGTHSGHVGGVNA
jgi:AhpD family alkylhydroperoxidase